MTTETTEHEQHLHRMIWPYDRQSDKAALAWALEEIRRLRDLAKRWQDAAFYFHDQHNLTQAVTSDVLKLIVDTNAALERACER